MSLPPQIPETARTELEWRKLVRNAVNACMRFTMDKGPTAGRPAMPTDGQQFYDRTLKKPIWWNADDGQWKTAAGANV